MPDARLSDRLLLVAGCGAVLAVFEPDEAVCAVRDAGSLTGFVGDLGLGLWKPVWGGEAPILVFGAEPCAIDVVGWLADFALWLGAKDALLGFLSGFLSGLFVA